jgi:hypothetical protein
MIFKNTQNSLFSKTKFNQTLAKYSHEMKLWLTIYIFLIRNEQQSHVF